MVGDSRRPVAALGALPCLPRRLLSSLGALSSPAIRAFPAVLGSPGFRGTFAVVWVLPKFAGQGLLRDGDLQTEPASAHADEMGAPGQRRAGVVRAALSGSGDSVGGIKAASLFVSGSPDALLLAAVWPEAGSSTGQRQLVLTVCRSRSPAASGNTPTPLWRTWRP